MIKKSQKNNFKLSWNLGFGTWNFSHGFTLIELLIVIVIVGILSTFVISNFIGIRERARDAQRKTDIRQIQTALQLFYADNGYYPSTTNFPSCGNPFTDSSTGASYMQEVPCDPSGDDDSYVYIPGSVSSPSNCSNGGVNECVVYELVACLENERDSDADETTDTNSCPEDGMASMSVTNP